MAKNELGAKAIAACMINLHSSDTLHNRRGMTKLNLLPSVLLNQREKCPKIINLRFRYEIRYMEALAPVIDLT